jgi:hypothetical protein
MKWIIRSCAAVFVALILAGAAVSTSGTGTASADCGFLGCINLANQQASNTATTNQLQSTTSGPTASVGAFQITVGGSATSYASSNTIQANLQRLFQVNFAP